MDEQLGQVRALIKSGRYSEARAILNKLDHPTARKWLQQLYQIVPALPDQEMKPLTSRVLVVLGGVMVALTLLVALYAAFVRPVGVAQADLVTVQNTVTDMKSTVANVQKDVTDTKDTFGTQMSDVDKKLSTIQADMAASASDSRIWEYLLFQYSQYDFCTLYKPPCVSEIPMTDNPKYDAQLWEPSKCYGIDGAELRLECEGKEFRGLPFYLNQLGSDGWELVNVVNMSDTTYRVEVYFKRIKQGDTTGTSSK